MARLALPARTLFGAAYLTTDLFTLLGTGTTADIVSVTGRTRGGSNLYILADFAGSNVLASGGLFFFLALDGVRIPHTGSGEGGVIGFHAAATQKRVAVAAGLHTVTLQFRTLAVPGAQGRIRPVADPDAEHAGLVVYEEFF